MRSTVWIRETLTSAWSAWYPSWAQERRKTPNGRNMRLGRSRERDRGRISSLTRIRSAMTDGSRWWSLWRAIAFHAIFGDKTLKVFEKDKDKKDDIEKELKKYKKDFDLNQLATRVP